MIVYFILVSIIIVLFLMLIAVKQKIKTLSINQNGSLNSQNSLPVDFIQRVNEILQKQQAHHERLIQTELMNLFRVPKLRGIQGEKWLESQLKEVLPKQLFSIQHPFESGAICDAVVFLPNGKKVPIDSKFSFDNFRKMTNTTIEVEIQELEKEFHKDIKMRINEMSSKYILPAEETIDFAFMFIPAESIYYQTFLEKDNGLLEYAFDKKVIITSPSSLYVYLQFVLYGFEGQQIEKSAKQIQQGLAAAMRDLKLFDHEYAKLKDKLDQAQKNYSNSSKYLSNAQANLNNLVELSPSKESQTMETL